MPSNPEVSLDTLPNEILFRIFSFLDAAFILRVLSRVCKTFEVVISEHTFWRTKLFQKWPKPYPVVPVSDTFDWQKACFDREEHYRRWASWELNMKSFRIGDPHIGHVNAIQLLNDGTLCASGARDRDIKIWNIQDDISCQREDQSQRLIHTLRNAHQGWVWCFCTHDNLLLSGSWDGMVKTWDLAQGCTEVELHRFRDAVLCLCHAGTVLSLGTYGGTVHWHDEREGSDAMRDFVIGKGPITCMAMDDTVLIAGCQAGSMTVVDLRMQKARQRFRKFDGYPSAVSYHSKQLWVGTQNGSVSTIDATADRLRCVQSISLGKEGQRLISGIHHSLGSVLVSFMGSTMYALEPTLNAEVISCGIAGQKVDRFQVHEDTLATAGSDFIEVWRPS